MLVHQVHRHLAGPETRQAHAALAVEQAGFDPVLECLGRNDDLEFARQPVRIGLCHLHRTLIRQGNVQPAGKPAGWTRLKLPRKLVRAEGLEPPRLASPEPKSGASTSSATPARPECCPTGSRPWHEPRRSGRCIARAAPVQGENAPGRAAMAGASVLVRTGNESRARWAAQPHSAGRKPAAR